MAKQEDIIEMRELLSVFMDCGIGESWVLLKNAKSCFEILKRYYKGPFDPLGVEIGSVSKNIELFEMNCNDGSFIRGASKNNMREFEYYKQKIVSYTKNAIYYIESEPS